MLLFLKTWRATVIPVVAIPVSLIGTCVVMQGFGFTLNMLTLFGLVLSVGIVVDDAIVVGRELRAPADRGLSPVEAARVSMDEVGAAIIAIALVLFAVFVPTTFITGITGQFYRQFAITIASATAISLLISLTLSPALCALLLKPHGRGAWQGRLPAGTGARRVPPLRHRLRRDGPRLRAARAHPGARLGARAHHLRPAGCLRRLVLQHLPTGFIPTLDRAIVIISLQLPPGSPWRAPMPWCGAPPTWCCPCPA